MLLGSEEEALKVLAKLDSVNDFATLAQEYSQLDILEEDKGDLGWFTRADIYPIFEDFAFNLELELGTLSEPVQDDMAVTTGGYWLLKVLNIDYYRQIEGENRDLLKAKLLNEWISGLWDDPENKVENYLDEEKKAWAISQVRG